MVEYALLLDEWYVPDNWLQGTYDDVYDELALIVYSQWWWFTHKHLQLQLTFQTLELTTSLDVRAFILHEC